MEEMIQNNTRKSIRSQVTNYYRRKIRSGELPPGSALPSAQQLAEEFGTAETNIHHAMTALVREGLIARRPRIGSVVLEQMKKLSGAAIYLEHHGLKCGDSFIHPFLNALNNAFVKHEITLHVVYTFETARGMSELRRLAEQQVIQGCIFYSIVQEDYANIRKLPIPCCGISDMRIPGAVYFFNETLVRRSLEALRICGCRSFGVIAPFSLDESKSRFPELLLRLAPQYGLMIRDEWKYSPNRLHVDSMDLDMKEFACNAMEMFRMTKMRPDGLLVLSDDLTQGIAFSLYKNHLRVPDDVRFVIHRMAEGRVICPFPCIYIESSIAEMAEMLVRNLQALYLGRKTVSRSLRCKMMRNDI